jgi:Zn-dependent protease
VVSLSHTRNAATSYNGGEDDGMALGTGLKVGRIFGIPIYLHPSWFIVFLLITPSLATSFNQQNPHWAPSEYWGAGILTSILFFTSVILHELGHSVIALRYKIPVVSITLFIFGGLARIGKEPEKPHQEFNIAIAGPIVSGLLAAIFWGVTRVFPAADLAVAMAGWLFRINLSLAIFNLAPGFPLDGGRILRAAAWAITGNFSRATRIASRSGKIVAYALIMYGVIRASYFNDLISGIWLALIGWFLISVNQESFAQLAIRESLEGLRAADIMTMEMNTVQRDISLEEYGHEVLRTGRRCHLVATNGNLTGLMTVHALNSVPRAEWNMTSVQAAMLPLGKVRWAGPDEPVLNVLDRMQSEDINQMPVLEMEPAPHVVGMVTRDSILRIIQARAEIGKLPN